MPDTRNLLALIVLTACASIALASAGSNLTGSFVHKSGSDQNAVAISVTVEARTEGKFLVSLTAAHPDAHGAAPDGEGEGRIDGEGVLCFNYEDSFSNKGRGTFRKSGKGYLLSIGIEQVKEPRCLVFYGKHMFHRMERKNSD
jgi:hypothetical protein